MLHRKVATCFITNWVSVLLDVFETTIYSVNSKNAHETRPSANASSTSDFKSYTTLPIDPIKSGHPSERVSAVDLEPPNPMIIVHIGRISNMMFTHPMWAVFSLFHQMCGTHCVSPSEIRLKPLTARSPSDILPVFVWDTPPTGSANSVQFYEFSSLGRSGLFLLWGVFPVICN